MSSRIPANQDADVSIAVTSCPICNRKYSTTEPRLEAKLLSCLDTFCMQCVEEHVCNLTTDYPWTKISCKLCQTPLELPEGRLQQLKTSPVVAFLLKIVAITSDPADSVCDACDGSDRRTGERGASPAEMYCEECDQNLCSDCLCAHGKLRSTKAHRRVVRLGSEESRKLAVEWKEMLPCCVNHKTPGSGESYCNACKVFLCSACSAVHEKKHGFPCRKARDLAQELRAQVSADAGDMARLGQASHGKRDTIAELKAEFDANIEATKKVIEERASALHEIIVQHEAELLKQLEKIRTETEDGFVEAEEAARQKERVMSRFVEFADLVSNVDLATLYDVYPMVSRRAAVLKEARVVDSVRLISVCFAPALWQQTIMSREQNCLGSIAVNTRCSPPETQTV